jgi:hypothetical protein
MARYFFDTSDGVTLDSDTEGVELTSEESARTEAKVALTDMAREKLPMGDFSNFSVVVRNEAGRAIYSASLVFDGQRNGAAAR